jgi:hypothetical protein
MLPNKKVTSFFFLLNRSSSTCQYLSCFYQILFLLGILAFVFPVKAAVWSIGIYTGESPLSLSPAQNVTNPVLTADDVTDVPATFVADPFIVQDNDGFHMFFEVLNASNNRGDIGYAFSDDGFNWLYQQIVLDEQFHLSYPYVFEWDGDYYMIPETGQTYSIRLYRATSFPSSWEFINTLIDGQPYFDPSIFYYDDTWWLFASRGNSTLHLFYSDTLSGSWQEHPSSPLITNNSNIARPGGRVIEYNNRLIRVAQDDYPSYGNQVRVFEILELTRTSYSEIEMSESPLMGSTGIGWNAGGMHHVDPIMLSADNWLAVVDGFGIPTFANDIPKDNWVLWAVDSEEVLAEDGGAANVFDGNPFTIWHTEWSQTAPPPPHDIELYLGGSYLIDAFRYLPRQDGGVNGRIQDYLFYVRREDSDWIAVASGTFPDSDLEQEVTFAPIEGEYIRLEALTSIDGAPWTSVAEISLSGSASTGNANLPPNGEIDTPTGDLTILSGEMVNFTGSATDPEADPFLSYLWSFGDPAIGNMTIEDPGNIQFNTPGQYTVTFSVTDSEGASDPTPAALTVTVTDSATPVWLAKTNWDLLSVDSEELLGEDGAATNAFDGDPNTFWHTEWSQTAPPPPHDIELYLGGSYLINAFRYLPRQDGGVNGRIQDYVFYVRSEGSDWIAVASGTFPDSDLEQEVTFAPIEGEYIRLEALTSIDGAPWTSVAEISVSGF